MPEILFIIRTEFQSLRLFKSMEKRLFDKKCYDKWPAIWKTKITEDPYLTPYIPNACCQKFKLKK